MDETNRYKARYRWQRVRSGVYRSPDGFWQAIKEYEHDRWRLEGADGTFTVSFLTLADCLEHADRMDRRRS